MESNRKEYNKRYHYTWMWKYFKEGIINMNTYIRDYGETEENRKVLADLESAFENFEEQGRKIGINSEALNLNS